MEAASRLPPKPPVSTSSSNDPSPGKPALAASTKQKKPQKTDAQHLADLDRIYDERIGNRLRAQGLVEEPFLIDNRNDYGFQPEPSPYSLSTRGTAFSYDERYMQYMRLRYEKFEQDGVDLRLHLVSSGTRRYVPPVERVVDEAHQAKKRKLFDAEREDSAKTKKKISLSEYKARNAAGSRAGTPAGGSMSGGEDLRKEVLKNVTALRKEETVSQSKQDARALPVTPTIRVEDVDELANVKEGSIGGNVEEPALPPNAPTITVEDADHPPLATKTTSHSETVMSDEGADPARSTKKQKTSLTGVDDIGAASETEPTVDVPAEKESSPATAGQVESVPSPRPKSPPPAQIEKEPPQQQEAAAKPRPDDLSSDAELPKTPSPVVPEQSLPSPASLTTGTRPASSADMPPPLAPLPDCNWDVTPPWLTPPPHDSHGVSTTPSSPDTIGPRGYSDSGTSTSPQKSETFDTWSSDSDRARKGNNTTISVTAVLKQKAYPAAPHTVQKKPTEAGEKAKAPRPKTSGWFASLTPSAKPPPQPSVARK